MSILSNKNNYLVSKKIGLIIVLLFIIPLVIIPLTKLNSPILDWQYFEQRYGAINQTILTYGQVPGNNPWSGGGTPIINSFYGIFGLCSLLFGVKLGIRIAVLIYFVIGYFGAYKLSIFLNYDKKLAQFFSLYFILSNSLAWHLYAGHINFVNIILLPYLIYLSFNIKNNIFLFGLLLGISFIDGPLYTGQYIVLIIGILNLYLILKSENKLEKICYYFISYILFLAISTYQILTLYPYYIEFPRIAIAIETSHSFFESVKLISIPSISFEDYIINTKFCSNTHENVSYMGATLIFFLILSFMKRKKYYILFPMLIFLIPFIDANSNLSIYYYLKYIPGFASHLCITRLRLVIPLIVGLYIILLFKKGVFKNLKLWNMQINENKILIIIILDLLIFSSIPIYKTLNSNYKNLSTFNDKNFYTIKNPENFDWLDLTKNNIGVLSITDSNIPINKISRFYPDVNYISEFIQNKQKIEPTFWSPNKMIFNVENSECIDTNIPYSAGWKLNGEIIPGNESIINMNKILCIEPNRYGVAEIIWERPFHILAINLSVAFLILFFVLFLFIKNKTKYS